MRFETTNHIAAPPDAVITMLAASGYADRRALSGDPVDWQASVTGSPPQPFTVRIRRNLPPSVIPPAFRAFAPDAIEVVQEENWDGAAAATFHVEVANMPVKVTGTIRLRPDGAGTALVTTGDVVASIPLFGGRVEKAIVGALDTVAAQEIAIAAAWLAEHRPA